LYWPTTKLKWSSWIIWSQQSRIWPSFDQGSVLERQEQGLHFWFEWQCHQQIVSLWEGTSCLGSNSKDLSQFGSSQVVESSAFSRAFILPNCKRFVSRSHSNMHVCCAQEAEQCAQQSILNTRRNFQYGLGNNI
jgi:hypothetical protein